MSGSGYSEDVRESRTRTQTRALNGQAAAGVISAIGPCEGGRVVQVERPGLRPRNYSGRYF